MIAHLSHQRVDCSKLSMLRRLLKTLGKFAKNKLTNNYLSYSTILGVVCKDGVILGTEKIVLNKMMVAGTDKRLYSINLNCGGVVNGLTPDGRSIIQRAREEGSQYASQFGIKAPSQVIADRVAMQF
jgi:20S proteasome alpha/beta subunit